jgi:hypothetical protein
MLYGNMQKFKYTVFLPLAGPRRRVRLRAEPRPSDPVPPGGLSPKVGPNTLGFRDEGVGSSPTRQRESLLAVV